MVLKVVLLKYGIITTNYIKEIAEKNKNKEKFGINSIECGSMAA